MAQPAAPSTTTRAEQPPSERAGPDAVPAPAEPAPGPPVPELLIVSGMSGAGRSTAGNVLEDLGWYVVDNLPAGLLSSIVDLVGRSGTGPARVAVVVDVRSGAFFAGLQDNLATLRARGLRPTVLFLEANDDVLVRRYESVRRPHPLQFDGRILDGIVAERRVLADLRARADLIIDTSDLSVRGLSARLEDAFAGTRAGLRAMLVSFGFKYGIPVDADHVVDCRFLPNPFWVPELRPQSGLADDVRRFVLAEPAAREFVDRYADLVRLVAAGYLAQDKRFVTIAVGCTGGKHRSVVIADELARRLSADQIRCSVVHRDLGRE